MNQRKTTYLFFIIILFVNIILFNFTNLYSQGFDWQYSPRLPHENPAYFIGIGGSSAYFEHKSSLDFIENNNLCANFNSGTGLGYSFGIKGEYWYTGLLAFNAGIGYDFEPGKFTSRSEPIPLINGDYYITEYDFQSKISYITLDLGAKYRILGSHFHFGLGLQFLVLASNNNAFTERIVAPDYAPPFPTNPPSYQRTIADGKIPDLYPLLIKPKINLGVDLTIGLGMYATPQISLGIPVMDATKSGTWKKWDFSFGISFYRGI